jgi:hypothetical protein
VGLAGGAENVHMPRLPPDKPPPARCMRSTARIGLNAPTILRSLSDARQHLGRHSRCLGKSRSGIRVASAETSGGAICRTKRLAAEPKRVWHRCHRLGGHGNVRASRSHFDHPLFFKCGRTNAALSAALCGSALPRPRCLDLGIYRC